MFYQVSGTHEPMAEENQSVQHSAASARQIVKPLSGPDAKSGDETCPRFTRFYTALQSPRSKLPSALSWGYGRQSSAAVARSSVEGS